MAFNCMAVEDLFQHWIGYLVRNAFRDNIMLVMIILPSSGCGTFHIAICDPPSARNHFHT